MIELKTPAEIDRMRKPAAIVGTILAELRTLVRPGVTTGELDRLAEKRIHEAGARSAFKNYKVGSNVFPAVLCTLLTLDTK